MSFAFAIMIAISIWADQYRILQMNTMSIKIGQRVCKIGDTFSDDDIIYWSVDKQAFKAQNLNSKVIRLFSEPAFRSKDSKTIKDYYLKTNHLSTRGGVISFKDLAWELEDTLFLYDTLHIPSPKIIDSTSHYYVAYYLEGQLVHSQLGGYDYDILVSRNALSNVEEGNTIIMSLFYSNKKWTKDILVTDSMKVLLLPEAIH